MPGITETSSNFGKKDSKWKFGTFITSIDGFGADVPSFNLKGESKVNTLFGGVVTALILLLTLGYSILKAIQLTSRSNPSINVSTIPSYFDVTETVNLNEINFRLAFSYRSYNSKELVDDPRYVRWIVRMRGRRDGKDYEELLPYHKCTDIDFE